MYSITNKMECVLMYTNTDFVGRRQMLYSCKIVTLIDSIYCYSQAEFVGNNMH